MSENYTIAVRKTIVGDGVEHIFWLRDGSGAVDRCGVSDTAAGLAAKISELETIPGDFRLEGEDEPSEDALQRAIALVLASEETVDVTVEEAKPRKSKPSKSKPLAEPDNNTAEAEVKPDSE